MVLNNLGAAVSEQGDLDAAQTYLDEALTLQQGLDDVAAHADLLANVANLALLRQDLASATWHASMPSLKLRTEIADRSGFPVFLHLLARLRHASGNLQESAWFYGTVDAVVTETRTTMPPILIRNLKEEREEMQCRYGEAAFEKAWSDGKTANWNEILAAAFAALHPEEIY